MLGAPETDITEEAVITYNVRAPNVNMHKQHEGTAGAFPGAVNGRTLAIEPKQPLFMIFHKPSLENRYNNKRRGIGAPGAVISTFNGLPKFGDDDFEIKQRVRFAGFPRVTWSAGLAEDSTHSASHIALQIGGSGSSVNNSNTVLYPFERFTFAFPSLDDNKRDAQYLHLHALEEAEKKFVPIVQAFDPVQETNAAIQKILYVALKKTNTIIPHMVQSAIQNVKLSKKALKAGLEKHTLIAASDVHRFAAATFFNNLRLAIDIGIVTPNTGANPNYKGTASTTSVPFMLDIAKKLALIDTQPPGNRNGETLLRSRVLFETFIGAYLRDPEYSKYAQGHLKDTMCMKLLNQTSSNNYGPQNPLTQDAKALMSTLTTTSSDLLNTLFHMYVASYDSAAGVILKGAGPKGKYDYKLGQ
jgi:hypothetical protein